jgi:hypothetical protein
MQVDARPEKDSGRSFFGVACASETKNRRLVDRSVKNTERWFLNRLGLVGAPLRRRDALSDPCSNGPPFPQCDGRH